MLKSVFYIILFFSSFSLFSQQNLILNGDFEEYWECPDNLGQIRRAKYCYLPINSTPDYMNACSDDTAPTGELIVSVPFNIFGNQAAQSGNAYIGLAQYWTPGEINDYREYVELTLSEALEVGKVYKVSFWVSVAEWVTYYSPNLQGKFVEDTLNPANYPTDNHLSITPDVYFDNQFVFDTIKWQKVEDFYVANGQEKYFIIGNFYNQNNTTAIESNCSICLQHGAYIYIDNFSIIESEITIELPNVITANNDGVNDYFFPKTIGVDSYKMTILNRWGNSVYNETNGKWDGNNEVGKPCVEGTYFYRIEAKDLKKNLIKKTGFIQLIR